MGQLYPAIQVGIMIMLDGAHSILSTGAASRTDAMYRVSIDLISNNYLPNMAGL